MQLKHPSILSVRTWKKNNIQASYCQQTVLMTPVKTGPCQNVGKICAPRGLSRQISQQKCTGLKCYNLNQLKDVVDKELSKVFSHVKRSCLMQT
jgi:hypothetical protein